MIDLSRRSFLRGSIALAGAVVLRPALSLVPTGPQIWGDGIHDDAPGLNALFAREPVEIMNDSVVVERAERITLRNGVFLITRPLYIRNETFVGDCSIIGASDFEGDCMINASSYTVISNCNLGYPQVGPSLTSMNTNPAPIAMLMAQHTQHGT